MTKKLQIILYYIYTFIDRFNNKLINIIYIVILKCKLCICTYYYTNHEGKLFLFKNLIEYSLYSIL